MGKKHRRDGWQDEPMRRKIMTPGGPHVMLSTPEAEAEAAAAAPLP